MLNMGTAKVMPEKQLSNTASRSRADEIATVGVFCQSVGIIIVSYCISIFRLFTVHCTVMQIQVGPSLRQRVVTDDKLLLQNILLDYFFPN